ncbi:MAG: PrsW family glutamic-type intramembrane protease, partial [SAR324 cluster bacterium]|nr:PrsW family glutamic-type intramembrane protease [SAR324 cluster bacterium]
ALGFAAVENIFYLERYGTITLLTRSILTVPAHAFFSAPMGVMMAYSRHAPTLGGKYLWLVGGLAVSSGFHGLYDVWLSLELEWMNWVAYAQVVLMGVLTWKLMRLKPLRPLEEVA